MFFNRKKKVHINQSAQQNLPVNLHFYLKYLLLNRKTIHIVLFVNLEYSYVENEPRLKVVYFFH